jgi:hypothetical protein
MLSSIRGWALDDEAMFKLNIAAKSIGAFKVFPVNECS